MKAKFFVVAAVSILWLASTPLSAQENTPTEPAVESPAPVETTPSAPPAVENPAPVETKLETKTSSKAGEAALPAENAEELDHLQDDLNILKEEIFRSKARTLLLQEFLVNTQVEVYFKNAAKKNYKLKSALYILDNSEIYKKEYAEGEAPTGRKEAKIFSGVTTPGRHEISIVLTYQGKKTAGYTENDYEFQITADYSFIAERGETTVLTLTAVDTGRISKDTDKRASQYNLEMDVKVESDRLAQIRRRIEKRTVMLMFESGVMVDSYQMVSDRLNINQQYASFIPFTARAGWWFLPNFGVEGYYTYAAWKAKTGINGQKIDMGMQWFGFDAKMRYAFFRSIMSPEVTIKVGYNFMNMKADGVQNPIVRTSEKYGYIDVGIEARFPVTSSFGIDGQFVFYPYVDLEETPVTSGRDGNTKGLEWQAGVYWNFWRDLSVTANYKFILLDNDFTGRATRTDANGVPLSLVQSRNLLQGVLVGLKYEF